MNLEKLYTKWRIKPCKVDVIIANHPEVKGVKMDSWEHHAPLGEFIKDYLEHREISWWKREWDWKIVNDAMVRVLNQVHVIFVGNVP